MALAYLDARDVMDRLDEVCGPTGWQCRYSHVGPMTVCEIGIFIPITDAGNGPAYTWAWKADGAGQSDIEAEKGALSDAFKRAAVRWGVGRYLYNLQSPWVEIETRGRSSVIKEHEYARLAEVLQRQFKGETERPALPSAESDITEAARRWVNDQKTLLSTIANAEDLKTWHAANKKNLDKLAKENEALTGDLRLAYKTAHERTNNGAQLQ